MISPGVFHGAYGLCSRLRSTNDGFRNADAACEMLVSGVKTKSEVPTNANASRSCGVCTGSPFTVVATSFTLSHSDGRPMTIIGMFGPTARAAWRVAMNLPSGQRLLASDAERLTRRRLVTPVVDPAGAATISRASLHRSSAHARSSFV